MAKPSFEPWFAVKVGARKNPKILALPNDTARLGWFLGVLAEAKLQRPGGRFVSLDQLLESIPGRFAAHVADYLRVGLLHEAPFTCRECRKAWGSVEPGMVVVHDWAKHQRDPGAPLRAAKWREDHTGEELPEGEIEPTNGDRTLDVRSENAGRTHGERSLASARTHSRESGQETVERISPEEIRLSSPTAPSGERGDVQALLDRGWPKVTAKQRKVLDEVADRHRRNGDDDGSAFALEAIRAAGEAADPIKAVLDADRLWQTAKRRKIQAEESIWTTAKGRDRAEAAEILGTGRR